MSYRIAQDYEYAGNNYWRWWAWIDAGSAALDEVSEVVWILHPSFKRPRVATTDRSTRFRLETSGWGVFLLRAELLRKDGEKHELRHNLRLEFPGSDDYQSKEAARSSPSRRSIFLSYSTADSRAATKLRTALEREGVTVMDKMQLGPGDPWRAALYEMISRADAVFGLIGDDDISPWVSAELGMAFTAGKPTVALIGSGAPIDSAIQLPSEIRRVAFNVDELDSDVIRNLLRGVCEDGEA